MAARKDGLDYPTSSDRFHGGSEPIHEAIGSSVFVATWLAFISTDFRTATGSSDPIDAYTLTLAAVLNGVLTARRVSSFGRASVARSE
jgi:hypothetical protein